MQIKNTNKTLPSAVAIAALFALTPCSYAAPATEMKPIVQTGTLVYPNGKPALDATVTVDVFDESSHVSTTYTYKPDRSGSVTFTLQPHLVGFDRIVYVTSPTGVGFWQYTQPGIASTTTLEPFTRVSIHLVDSDGAPIPHVKVCPRTLRLDRTYGRWRPTIPGGWTQSTDNSGNATIAQLPQGFALTLNVDDDRYAPPDLKTPIQLATSPTTPNATVQVSLASSITGAVVFSPSNKPVVGIKVYATAKDQSQVGGMGITDQNGAFTIGRLNKGNYSLSAPDRKGDFKDWVTQPQVVSAEGHTMGAVLHLIHGGVITGKVTDKTTGKPVPNVGVSISATQIGSSGWQIDTDEDGRYTLRMLPGVTSVMPTIPGATFDSTSQKQAVITEDQTTIANIQVDSSAFPKVVHGVVLGPDGKPLAGAEVDAVAPMQAVQKIKTDAAGKFILDSPGLISKEIVLARCGDLGTTTPIIYGGESALTIRLMPGTLGSVSGRVQDQNGGPILNAHVVLFLTVGNAGMDLDQTLTDATGRYTFVRAYSNVHYSAEANPTGYSSANAASIPVVASQSAQFPPMVVTLANSFIGGTVANLKGKPVGNVSVMCPDMQNLSTRTDDAGHFMLKGVPNGNIFVYVQSDNGPSANVQLVSGSADNVITLPTAVTGVVVDQNGKPVSGAEVIAPSQQTDTNPITTDSSGHFAIGWPGLKLKDSLRARAGHLTTANPVYYNGDDTITLHLTLGTTSTVEGQIKNSDGSAIGGATVSLVLWEEDMYPQIAVAQTDAQGHYSFPFVFGNAKYSIRVQASGHGGGGSSPVQAAAGKTAIMPIVTLPRADSFVGGTVVDAKGSPVAGITIKDADVTNVEATTDSAGHFLLEGVPSNKTSVYYETPGGAMDSKDLTSGRADNMIYLPKIGGQK